MASAGENAQSDGLHKDLDWDFFELLRVLREGWKLLVLGSLLCGILAHDVAFRIDSIYTARSTFLPPQQGQSSAALALLESPS